MFTEILNPFITVRNKIRDSRGEWVDQRNPIETQHATGDYDVVVTSNTDIVVFETWGRKVILDSLSYTTDTDAFPRLETSQNNPIPYNTQIFHSLTLSGSRSANWPSVIELHGHGLFEIISTGDTTNGYHISLKRPIILPEGCRLEFGGGTSADGYLAYKVYWREIDV